MALNKLIIILIFLISGSTWAQENFLRICNQRPRTVPIENEMKWLRYYFKTTDCSEIASKISKLTSFNQFMVSEFVTPKLQHNWSSDFDYLNHLPEKFDFYYFPWSKVGFEPDHENVFKNPEIYAEFKNLHTLDLSRLHNYNVVFKDLCNINKILPHVKTVVLGYADLYKMEKDCLDHSKLPWIIAESDNGKNITKLNSRIIGFMNFGGSIKNLIKFRYLRYLGINNSTVDNDMKFLSKNLNLTHLSLNMFADVKNIQEIRDLRNLKFLSLNCIHQIKYVEERIDSVVPCKTPYLDDISFLAELPWLENLDLTSSNIEDISVVSKMKRLKKLNVSYNNIKVMPDLSHLKDLKEINFTNNPASP